MPASFFVAFRLSSLDNTKPASSAWALAPDPNPLTPGMKGPNMQIHPTLEPLEDRYTPSNVAFGVVGHHFSIIQGMRSADPVPIQLLTARDSILGDLMGKPASTRLGGPTTLHYGLVLQPLDSLTCFLTFTPHHPGHYHGFTVFSFDLHLAGNQYDAQIAFGDHFDVVVSPVPVKLSADLFF
jgi:hypothetical protein